MGKSAWFTNGLPIDRVAKGGIHYEPDPEVPQWILRDRTKEGLSGQLVLLFNRIAAAVRYGEQAKQVLGKRSEQLNAIRDSSRVVSLLTESINVPQLSEFCIRTIEGNISSLQHTHCWRSDVRELFTRRLSLLKRRVDDDQISIYVNLLRVAKLESSDESKRPNPIAFRRVAPVLTAKEKKALKAKNDRVKLTAQHAVPPLSKKREAAFVAQARKFSK